MEPSTEFGPGYTKNSWTVVERDTARRGQWLCRCVCGNIGSVVKHNLVSGKSTQCRVCADSKGPTINLVGRVFGALTVQAYVGYVGGTAHAKWKCVCACGTEHIASGANLRSGRVKACAVCGRKIGGAAAAKTNTARGTYAQNGRTTAARKRVKVGVNYTDQTNPWRHHASKVKDSAKRRGLPFGFADHFELALYLESIAPVTCPVTGERLEHGTKNHRALPVVDRIDNTLGYVRGNLQVISFMANAMKRDADFDTLVAFAGWIIDTHHREVLGK